MAKFFNKISNLITSQVPDFVLDDHPKFVEFLKTYYTFMESAELAVTSVQTTDGITLETETNQDNKLVLDGSRIDSDRTQLDAGDKLILESSAFGKFTRGEIITGQTSKATSTILAEDLDNGRLFITAQNKFAIGEIILGATSNASAVVNDYRPNPVNNIQELLDFRDPDKAVSNFLTKFRNEFLNTIPEEINANINKRNLIKNIKSLYRLKGTNTGHQIFFRLLFGLESETTFPREQILRVSDGKWNTSKILRVITTAGDTANLIGRTIEGQTSDATAVIENVFKFQIGTDEVSELIVNNDTVVGTFSVGEEIRGTSSDDSDIFIKANISGIPNQPTITNDGSLYTTGDTVAITAGGEGAIIQVDDVGRGGITELFIDDAGAGYAIDDDLVFNNTNTSGGSAVAKIAIVNGGITPEDATAFNFTLEDNSGKLLQETSFDGINSFRLEDGDIDEMILLEDGDLLLQEENTDAIEEEIYDYFTQEGAFTANEDHIVLEDETVRGSDYIGNKFVQESGTGVGDITDVRIIDAGSNYLSLPVVTITSSGGSGAFIKAYGSEIGRVQSLKIVEPGKGYENSPTPPILKLPTYLLIVDRVGSFSINESVSALGSDGSTTITATVVGLNASTNILEVSDASGTFGTDVSISGNTSGATATIKKFDQSTATTTVTSILDTAGTYINQDGHLSENVMRIQDSLLYQDFSYVIKVGRTINDWRDSFKKTVHTAGFYFVGQVNIVTQVSAELRSVTGINSGEINTPIDIVINTLFTTIFGRRLGTVDDGTTLRASPQIGEAADFNTSTTSPFSSGTRDVTLKREYVISFPIKEKISIRNNNTKFGRAVAGPSMFSIDKLILGDNYAHQITIQNLIDLRLTGTLNENIDGELNNLSDFNFKLKTNFTVPSEVWQISNDSFDETFIKFDQTDVKFDVA